MDPIVVDIPGVGPVEFPASMSQDQINLAAKKLHDEANKEPVVEKESPELFGYAGAGLGAMGAAGDVIYSKGRPIIRAGEKMLGMQPSGPAIAKPRTFQDPSTVAQGAIERRSVAELPEGTTSTIRNWTVGKPGEGTGQHAGDFLGGSSYGQADEFAKERAAFEAANPTMKVQPVSRIAIPEKEAQLLAKQRAELQAQQNVANQAEVNAVAQTRAQRLAERDMLQGKLNKKNVLGGGANIAGKVALPVLGGYEAGTQGTQAFNRLSRPDLQTSDVASGVTNLGGSVAGLRSMFPGKGRIPAAIAAQGAAAVANWLDKRNPRNEEVEQKAQGGLIQHFESGRKVVADKALELAKKASSGYLHHTEKNPNPLVGTRFEVKDLGGLAPVKPMGLEDIRGHMIHTKPWDLSARNRQILSVSGKPLTTEIIPHGGQGYVRDLEHMDKGIGGASAFPISNQIQKITDISSREGEKLGGTGQVTMTPSTMSKFSEDYAIPTFDTYKNLWDQAEPGADRTGTMLQRLRFASPETLKTQTPIPFAGMVKDVKYPFRDLEKLKSLDFNDPEVADLFLRIPDLRKALIKEWRSKENQKMMGYNAEDLSAAHTDPDLLGIPPGYAGHTMIEMQPGSRPSLSSNITYDTDYAGKYSGSIGHTPSAVLLNDAYSKISQEMRQLHPSANEDKLHRLTMGALYTRNEGVSDLVDDKMINRVGAYHEGVKQNKINPNDIQGALQFLAKPGAYKEGGLV